MLKVCFSIAALLLLSVRLAAQTPTDMQFVPKGSICAGVNYSYNSWNKYWEGKTLRENGNVGTVSRQNIAAQFNLGVWDRVNFIAMLPYVITNASQGTLSGQNGFQDINLNVKAKYAEIRMGAGQLNLGGNLGFSTPVNDYLIDFAPLNLGAGTTNVSYRQMVNYQLDKGYYAGVRANYTHRSNVPDIHRDFYFDDGTAYYGNEVQVDDVLDWTASIGYSDSRILAEIDFNSYNTLGGSDIRTWDPGFPSNNTDFNTLVGRFDYYFSESGGLNISVIGGYTLSGRNAGQSILGSIAVNYQFPVWGK